MHRCSAALGRAARAARHPAPRYVSSPAHVTTAVADGLDRIPHLSSTRGVLRGLDYAGTLVFAASGSIAAAESGLDVCGCIAVGTVTAVGGGTLRDLVIFARPPFWSGAAPDGGEPEYLLLACVSAAAAFFCVPLLQDGAPNDDAADAVALGAFAVIGAMNGARAGLPFLQSLLCGVVTGTGGGTVRDVWLRRPVRIFHSQKELYATCAAVGAATFLGAPRGWSFAARVALGVGSTAALRAASLAGHLRLPTWK